MNCTWGPPMPRLHVKERPQSSAATACKAGCWWLGNRRPHLQRRFNSYGWSWQDTIGSVTDSYYFWGGFTSLSASADLVKVSSNFLAQGRKTAVYVCETGWRRLGKRLTAVTDGDKCRWGDQLGWRLSPWKAGGRGGGGVSQGGRSRVGPDPPAPWMPHAPQGRKNREVPEKAGHGERDEQGEITRQARPRSPKTVQSAEGGEGKDQRERIVVVVRSPCQEHDPADAHPSAHKSVLESANPRMDSGCASGCTWSTARATAPSPGRPTPGVVKQDKSSGGSVDTTKTRSDPQRVRMSSGERPIGAAKGKQIDTEALCQPPPPLGPPNPHQ